MEEPVIDHALMNLAQLSMLLQAPVVVGAAEKDTFYGGRENISCFGLTTAFGIIIGRGYLPDTLFLCAAPCTRAGRNTN